MKRLSRMTALKTRRSDSEKDQFTALKFFLRVMFAWPEDDEKHRWVWIIGNLYQVPNGVQFLGVVYNFFMDPKPGGALDYMQTFADGLGFLTLLVKGWCIFYQRQEIVVLTALINEFALIEQSLKTVPIRKKRPKWPWFPTFLFLLQTFASLTVITLNAMNPNGEERSSSVPTPKIVLRTDAIYYPWISVFIVAHITNWFTYGAIDGCYACFTHIIKDKASTLKKAIKNLQMVQDEDLDQALGTIIRYHQLIIRLHQGTEHLCRGPNFGLVFHIVISLGCLIIRIVFVGLPPGQAAFSLIYAIWLCAQLHLYCFLGDDAALSGTQIAKEAFESYRPGMPPDVVRKLVFVILRGQKPMNLTAWKVITLNKHMFLEIMKRSYSGFSALSHFKGTDSGI